MTGGRVFSIALAAQPTTGTVRSMSVDLVGRNNGYFGESDATFSSFEGIIQTGVHIDDPNAPLLAAPMPWQHLRYLTVDDLASIFTYLQFVQTQQPTQLTTDKATQDASYYCTADTDCDALNGGNAGVETCDLTPANATYHECVGRSCVVDSDCRVCQTCTGTVGSKTCGGPLSATCASGI